MSMHRLDLDDLCALQGWPPKVRARYLGVVAKENRDTSKYLSGSLLRAALGNGMSFNVLDHVFASLAPCLKELVIEENACNDK